MSHTSCLPDTVAIYSLSVYLHSYKLSLRTSWKHNAWNPTHENTQTKTICFFFFVVWNFNIKTCAIISWDLVKFQTCETTSIDGIVFFFKITILWLSRGLFFKEIFLTIYLWDYLTWKIKSFEYFSIYFDFLSLLFRHCGSPFF